MEFGSDEQISATQCCGGVDSVDGDLVVDGDESLPVTAVEGLTQVGECLTRPDNRRAQRAGTSLPSRPRSPAENSRLCRAFRFRMAARPAIPASTNSCW